MAMELRPMRVGELLDRTFSTLRQHFLLFVGLVLVPIVAGILLPLPFLPHSLPTGERAATALLPFRFLIGLGFGLILFPAAMGATAAAVDSLARNDTATVRDSWRKAGRRIPALVGAILLAGLAVGGAGISFVVPVIAYVVFRPLSALIGFVVAAVLGLAAAAFILWVFVGLALAQLIVVVEEAGPLVSLRRSWELARGGRWHIALVYVLYFVISFVVNILCTLPFTFLAAATVRHGGDPLWLAVTSNWVGLLVSILLVPLLGIGLTLAYLNQRVRKEAFDLQVMMTSLETPPTAGAPLSGAEPLPDGQ
jgi:hypothetical protein